MTRALVFSLYECVSLPLIALPISPLFLVFWRVRSERDKHTFLQRSYFLDIVQRFASICAHFA
jgi:hypothetical protein